MPTVSEMTDEEKRKQVADQCKVVAHLATVLTEINSTNEAMIREGSLARILDIIGRRTAYQMEQLGDMLNAMDAAEEEDEWMDPIFEKAHQLWPQEDQSNAGK